MSKSGKQGCILSPLLIIVPYFGRIGKESENCVTQPVQKATLSIFVLEGKVSCLQQFKYFSSPSHFAGGDAYDLSYPTLRVGQS